MDVEQTLLMAKEAAKFLRISPRKLHDLTKRGVVPCVRMDRSVRYDSASLKAFIQACLMGSTRSKGGV